MRGLIYTKLCSEDREIKRAELIELKKSVFLEYKCRKLVFRRYLEKTGSVNLMLVKG